MPKLASLLVALIAPAALAATRSEGVPIEVRRGVFTETNVGGFFTVGGDNHYSNLQTYLQLGVGYQLTLGEGRGLVPIGAHFGIGANAQNCFAGLTKGVCNESDNFTVTFLGASGGYLHRVVERLYVGGKALAGWTLLDPPPVSGARDSAKRAMNQGLNIGVAASVEYATLMDHFSIGLDVAFRVVLGVESIMSLSFYPRVQYTF